MTNKINKTITNTTAEAFRAAQEDPLLALAMGMPGVLEHQERVGQQELVASTQLPCRGLLGADRPSWEAVGVRILDANAGMTSAPDPLFCRVQLPEGWSLRATDHPMWSDLVDVRGRVRGRVFYKAAFYDRSAHIRMEPRFRINLERGDWETSTTCRVRDAGQTVFETATVAQYFRGDLEGPARQDALLLDEAIEMVLRSICLTWLVDRGVTGPRDASAYWDYEVPVSSQAPSPRAPEGKLSGEAAVIRAADAGSLLRLGSPIAQQCEVSPRHAQILVSDGVCSVDLFWIDEPSVAVEGARCPRRR